MTGGPDGLILRAGDGTAFSFDPGALCLELLTTGGPGRLARWESLHTPADLAAWADASRLTPTPELDPTPADVTAARRLRDALWRLAAARIDGEPPAAADLTALNAAAAHPPLAPQLTAGGARRWAAGATGGHLLATVAGDAVALFGGPQRERLRRCSGERCDLLYVDTSRPGNRRWCSMARCGNRHKVRTLRTRRADAPDRTGTPGRNDAPDRGRPREWKG